MKNWKTTLIGVGSAVLIVIVHLIAVGTVDPNTLLVAGSIAAIGAFAKDHDVTGGTIVQSSLPLATAVLGQLEKTNSSPVLDDIHQVLTSIEKNTAVTAAPPADLSIVTK